MAAHDYSIANATGLNFRTDLNNALAAIVSQNSGSIEPVTKFPGMLWLDLSGGGDGIMRRRNQANDAWLTDIGVDNVARSAAATAQAKADRALLRDASATVAERTMVQPLILPNAVPLTHEAVSRTQADLLYQVKLPAATAGSLLIGAAGGWTVSAPAGASDSLLTISGGVPIWQNTASIAAPNAVVRTLADGTIDPSFIPAVASGLKYRGTFKPVVNDEYPAAGDNGSGAGGVPAVGDFWVIDGLTTGGYTYLTGSLAGVSVFNGDSIAYDGAAWFKMGSTINLSGYLKTDGSTAMTGALNMGAQAINNVSGIAGVVGSPVPLTNFKIDATNVVINPQRGTTGPSLPAMATGQLGTDLGRMQIYVGGSGVNVALVPVRYFSATEGYVVGDYVVDTVTGAQYRANVAVSAGAFTRAQWSRVIDENYATFRTAVRATSIAADQNPAIGKSYLQQGTASQPGYLDLTTADDVRRLIVGASDGGTNTLIQSYNGWGIKILGGPLSVAAVSRFSAGLFASDLSVTNGAASLPNGFGAVGIVAGTAALPGYVAFYTPDGNRRGFIGWGDGNNLVITGDNNWGWTISGQAGTLFSINIPTSHNAIVYTYTGSVGAQQVMAVWGWNNRVQRIAHVMESNAAYSIWTYNASGGNALPIMTITHTNGGTGENAYFRGNVAPMVDNGFHCGLAANRYVAVWAVNGTIQTSDEREKTPIAALTQSELDLGTALIRAGGSFFWLSDLGKDGPARKHYGIGAQTANGLMVAHGIGVEETNITTHSAWAGNDPVTNDEGDVVIPGTEAGDRYGMTMDQVFMLALAAIDQRLTTLENVTP